MFKYFRPWIYFPVSSANLLKLGKMPREMKGLDNK